MKGLKPTLITAIAIGVLAGSAVGVAASAEPTSTTAPAPVTTTSTSPSATSTTGAGEATVDPSAAVAAGFLAARENRDLETVFAEVNEIAQPGEVRHG